jgi:hypothetical protein
MTSVAWSWQGGGGKKKPLSHSHKIQINLLNAAQIF